MSAAAATLGNKREVRDRVKQTLQPLVDDGTIESEELKAVVKSAGDAVSTLPAASTDVEVTAFTELLALLNAASAAEEVLEKVRQRLTECQKSVAATKDETAALVSGSAAATVSAGAGIAAHADGAPDEKKSFTFGALKARLAKKKEELHAVASSRTDDTGLSTMANTPAPGTAIASVTASVAPSETRKGQSTNASLGASPALRPTTATSDAPPPPVVELDAGDGASEASRPRQQGRGTSDGGPAPAVPAAKPEGFVLTAAPLMEDDLYADFIGRGRGRGRGAEGGRGGGVGRGGPGAAGAYGTPYRGRGGHYGPPPLSERGRGGYPYQGPTRGGYPQPPYAPHTRGGSGFRPY